MDNTDSQVEGLINVIKKLENELDGKDIKKGIADELNFFFNNIKRLEVAIKSEGDYRSILNIYNSLAIHGNRLASLSAQDFEEEKILSLASDAYELSSEIAKNIENYKAPYSSRKKDIEEEKVSLSDYQKARNEASEQLNGIKRLLNDTEAKYLTLELKVKEASEAAQDEINKLKLAYSEALEFVDIQKNEINKMISDSAKRIIAGDYEETAAQEKSAADTFRAGSIILMLIIMLILGAQSWHLILGEFQWQRSILSITLAFLFSVPAAYLARESAKHRQQQYNYHQNSLDLKAITPYIASLPEDQQHKIKMEIASRIFAHDKTPDNIEKSYPINLQEIIIKLIERAEPSKEKP